MRFKTLSASVYGIDAHFVQGEVDVGVGGMEDFYVVGLPDNAVKESRQRVKSALKNCGIVYEDVQGKARLAPAYDLVTTSVYLPKDSMALTLNGTTKWASTKELQRLGETRMGATPARVREILERIAAATEDTSAELHAYIKDHQEFENIGNRMLHEWEQGVALSLKPA
jgi:predicted ATPase with chaperone activity